MNLPRRKVVIGLVIASAVIIDRLFLYHSGGKATLRKTLNSCKLARLPSNSQHLSISSEHNGSTRAFHVSFTAPASEINEWLNRSSGIGSARIEPAAPSGKKFVIQPDGGAAYAEVVVNEAASQVRIYVYFN